jgi:ribosomal protein S18 acetylase RimI-like enzyme
LVATVVDGAENGAGAAVLEVLAARGDVPPEAFAEVVVAPAVAFARGGPRRTLHVAIPAGMAHVTDVQGVLRRAGFALAYESFTMVRRADVDPPAGEAPLPAGWRWAALDDGRVEAAHALLTEAFRGAPSFSLSPLPVFRRNVAAGGMTCRLLLDSETIVGFVNVVTHEERGELRTVARAPAYRGRGVGDRLVGEGLRLLLVGGARDVELNVEAHNERALDLYRRSGFEVASRAPVFALALR